MADDKPDNFDPIFGEPPDDSGIPDGEPPYVQSVPDDYLETVGSKIEDAPKQCLEHIVPKKFRLQNEWPHHISPSVVFLKALASGDIQQIPVSNYPILISAWCTNETTGEKALEIQWKALGKWHSRIISLEALSDGAKIIGALSKWGFPVTSSTRTVMVDYLAAYRDTNIEDLPVRKISHQMGWQEDGSFLVGRQCIGAEPGKETRFVGRDVGEDQIADGLHPTGDFDAWKTVMVKLSKYPKIELALYASLAPVLLEVLKEPNFVLDYAYRTSSGKTTALRVAASVWGCPDERLGKSFIYSWDATKVWVERAGSCLTHLPLLLDDTKRAQKGPRGESVVPAITYSIGQGRGRGRGSLDGTRGTTSWRTILIMTGESRAVDESKDGGTAARILSLWGSPFDGNSPEIAKDIRELNDVILENYGHAGPAFVERVVAAREHWPKWRKRHRDLVKEFAGETSSVGQRLAGYLATLELTAQLAHKALGLPWDFVSPVKQRRTEMLDGTSQIDRAYEAMRHSYEWAVSNRSRFWRKGAQKINQPWLGRWDRDASYNPEDPDTERDVVDDTKWEWIAFSRQYLIDELDRVGFDAKACIRLWHEQKWLKEDQRRPGRYTTRVDGELVPVVALLRTTIDGLVTQPVVTE